MSAGYFVGIGLDFQEVILTGLSKDARALLSEIISIRGDSTNGITIRAENAADFSDVFEELESHHILAHVKADDYFLNPDAVVVAQQHYKAAKAKWDSCRK